MLIPIQADKGLALGDQEVEDVAFADLKLIETDVEEFLRKNISAVFEEAETLLIVGQQVVNTGGGRSDLIGIDDSGSIVLIEIKRDELDIKTRKEAFEFQAIRYAASLAKIRTAEDVVDRIFGRYIERHKDEFGLGELTAREKGCRLLGEFLRSNKAEKTFNQKQRIILLASSFDKQTLSAVAWLIKNKVDIAAFELSPKRVGSALFLDVQRILPPDGLDDFFMDVVAHEGASRATASDVRTRTFLPRMRTLMEWGILKKGDILFIVDHDDSEAEVADHKAVRFKGAPMSFNDWGSKVTGWSSICIYEWAALKGQTKTLAELRQEKMESLTRASDGQQ